MNAEKRDLWPRDLRETAVPFCPKIQVPISSMPPSGVNMALKLLCRCRDDRHKIAKDPHPGCTVISEIPGPQWLVIAVIGVFCASVVIAAVVVVFLRA